MSVQKDSITGKWMVQCRVTDWQGNVTHKKKRGFPTKKEAQEWERNLLSKAKANVNMLFGDFIELYFEDLSHRLKASTLANKHWIVDQKNNACVQQNPIK